ncbi:NUDIX hydrolase [Aliidiomarina sp. Khilg15.8]
MRLLTHLIHESITQPVQDTNLNVLAREASRGIVLQDSKILLMYTERYDDFSFPGGGIDAGEDPVLGLRRELAEEAGAHDVAVLGSFGKVTEYLPCWKPDWDLMYQTSYWYHCELVSELQANQLEHYEIANGMAVHWVDINEAIRHNQKVIAMRPSTMGLAIGRETHVLERVAAELVTGEGV